MEGTPDNTGQDAPPVQSDAPQEAPPTETTAPTAEPSEVEDDNAGVEEALQRDTADGPGDSLPTGDDPDVSDPPSDVETPKTAEEPTP